MASFLIDAQLPPGLAARLRSSGHRAEHVAECGLHDSADELIAARAESCGAILISKDEDFVTLATLGKINCKILWIRFGNTTNLVLWDRLSRLLNEVIEAFEAGESLIEVG